MKCNQFEEGEIPYGALEKFGLSHEMIEDLPMHVLEDIWNGRQSPVLPIHVTDDEGELIKSRTRFSLVRMEDGKVDVMFYPVLKYALLEQFDDNQQQLLKDGKAVVADVTSPQGTIIKAFVQIDPETNQVMNVPTPVIGRNLQVLSEELGLGSAEIKTMQNGQPLTFVIDDEPVTVGIDLNSNTGIRFAQGDEQQWKERGKREWDKFTFGCYGCWVTDDEGNHDYVVEDEYTEELWNEQKKSAQRNASLRKEPNKKEKNMRKGPYYSEDILVEKMQRGEYNWLDYINHFSEEWQDEYEEYCREYSLSIGNESAEQFVNYKSEQLEKAMEEGNA